MDTDVVVIGAGFGGLSAALHLAEAGRRVVVCEALNYPGGCASTFSRNGHRFEAGATLFAGLGEGQWMHGWLERFGLPVELEPLDSVMDFRAPDFTLKISASRKALVEQFATMPGAPRGVRAFFTEIERTADVLWELFDAPQWLPPLTMRSVVHHIGASPKYLRLLPGIGRSLGARMRAHGVHRFEPLRLWVDAACQITVQTTADEAEAPVAMAAIDYFFRGASHIRGGIGALASAVVQAIEHRGGEVRYANRVKGLRREGQAWVVDTRAGVLRAPSVVANLLPGDVARLLGEAPGKRAEQVRKGWGAAMLYLVVQDEGWPPGSLHIQAVLDPTKPLVQGNLVLVSIAERDPERAPEGMRGVTVSTHLPVASSAEQVAVVQERMRQTLQARIPELAVVSEMTASPRTFERFTRREQGLVGGIPRTAGVWNYLDLWPVQYRKNLWLAGDSAFPGQSVLAVSVGGSRVAAAIR